MSNSDVKEQYRDLIERFEELTTGNLSDAMDNLGLQRGVITGLSLLTRTEKKRLVGFAYTMKQMTRHQASQGAKLAKHSEAINKLADPGDVLVIDAGGRLDVCNGGGLLAMRAKIRGLAGFVVNGCYRDIDEINEFGFPIFARAATPVRSTPDQETVGFEIPVEIDGVQIRTGDILVADRDGVIVIPPEQARAIVEEAQSIAENEIALLKLVCEGMDFMEAYSKVKL
ncbi:MAG: RraA family protein [Peptococcaceae bacterium]|jgi:regulator of RNase E activity RraA|nr:RraA family protein [Peptococcaceae bacterium]